METGRLWGARCKWRAQDMRLCRALVLPHLLSMGSCSQYRHLLRIKVRSNCHLGTNDKKTEACQCKREGTRSCLRPPSVEPLSLEDFID
eukprot:1139838-Pelagomonas_calceolata.AAC.5